MIKMPVPNQIEPRTLPGFRDFLPESLRVRKRVIQTFVAIFEKYGFEPLETPTLEYQDILLGKYGAEAEKLMYLFKDNGGRDVGLRYDLTVPTARVLAQYPNLPKPWKRYQIQPAWRAEKPQKGRYREFTQCDIDTFGTTSPMADAEILAVIAESLQAVGFKKFTIRLNSRQVLFKIMEDCQIPKESCFTVIQSIDKLDKKSETEVKSELEAKGVAGPSINSLFQTLSSATPDPNLKEVISYLKKFQVPEEFYRFDPILARGLDYYTGPIFETVVTEPKIGSITGGGRYDNLIGQFTGTNIPAVGTTIGLDRTVDVITDLNLWPDLKTSTTKALITIFSPDLLDASFEVDTYCYEKGLPVETYLDPTAKLERQLKYADQKGIPYAVIIGPDEAGKGLVTVKNLKTKTQITIPKAGLADELK